MAVEAFDVVDLIHAKRDHGALSTGQINWLVDAYTRGYVADEQMAAMAMAIFLNGMDREEVRDLTLAMIASGEITDSKTIILLQWAMLNRKRLLSRA